jgi:YidC/Oxa1 family membrane protein insertase
MLVMKNVNLDQDKIHTQLQVKKKQPKKENRFYR